MTAAERSALCVEGAEEVRAELLLSLTGAKVAA
jgi:hypothetical protein